MSTELDERPDVLGSEWVARTLPLAPDEADPEGELVATLVRKAGPPSSSTAVLYVHGFTDYFFQDHHARAWAGHGIDFYALDLRRYGRSLRAHHAAGDVRDLRAYDEEISAAISVLRAERGHERVILLGHSTGGLILSLYAHAHPRAADALVLNSPWFDLNEAALRRMIATPLAESISRLDPTRRVGKLGGAYGRSLHTSTGGSWEYDLAWKPIEGFPVRAGWLRAIRRAQARVARGLDVRIPVLVCSSTRSGGVAGRPATPEELASTDTVLDVQHMWRGAQGLGDDVTIVAVPGGLHDLTLSAPRARADFERAVFTWLSARLP
ncbi:conserved hypothetical protein [Beutenbergia cavernae DSM 12333]|uniref:Serine aminopeptidase S33 domain-containing protein n=1 Tax=Beutenbergia cavernae (strain ATCC BAA-8 / DSM 12333 / CCUG 43141 / JCM 11478 / NBRC 16432 / NCIMB 13614 / HKI 0122) TaxID=471853 RepID=C5BX55_BEUC1|nr:alpha/beta hydrolase [Beutenbergia cavernae]ACQ78730.1 conserved hypothetical protein [Beutenbergia cavernae DSM 12333]